MRLADHPTRNVGTVRERLKESVAINPREFCFHWVVSGIQFDAAPRLSPSNTIELCPIGKLVPSTIMR